MPTTAEAEHQETFDLGSILSCAVFVHLIDLGLVHLNFAAAIDDVLLVGFKKFHRHLGIIAFAPGVNLAFFGIGFVDYFLVFVPYNICFGSADSLRGRVHLVQNAIQTTSLCLRPGSGCKQHTSQ